MKKKKKKSRGAGRGTVDGEEGVLGHGHIRRERHLHQGCVISKSVISYISWDLITSVTRGITFRADNISARALGKLL